MRQAVYILFGAVFTSVVSLALGRILFKKLRVELYRQEELPLAFVVGSGCLSFLIFVLAAAQLVYKGVFLAAGLALIAYAVRSGAFRTEAPGLPALKPWMKYAGLAVAAPFFTLSFFHAMAPEMSPDGTAYHLALVARYYREHGFGRLTTNMYGNLTQGVEMLFLFAFAFGRHSAAALTHFAFLLALPAMVLGYMRRAGRPSIGVGAALVTALSPVMLIDGASAYNDVAVAAIVFAGFYLVQIWDQTRSNALLIPIGLVCGFAFASKYTAFLVLPYAAGVIVWRMRGKALRPLATVGAVAALMIAPWLIKNIIIVRNPVSPFFNRVFPNPFVHVSFEDEYRHHMRNYDGLGSKWEIPLEVTVRGQVLCGLLGPLFLLAPVALLGLGRRLERKLLLCALLFGSVYVTNIGTRFLIPALPFVAMTMALVFGRVRYLLAVVVLAHAVSAWPAVMKQYCATYAWRLDKLLWKEALRIVPEDRFLTERWPFYSAARMMEYFMPPGTTALSFNQTSEAYTNRDLMVVYQSAKGNVLGRTHWIPIVDDYQSLRWVEYRFPRTEVEAVRVRQNASDGSEWNVAEIRLFDGEKELAREETWRLTADPNPWYVTEAFDNSIVTRWGSWQPMRAGMYLQAGFGEQKTLDRVVLQTSMDSVMAVMEIEGLQKGEWRALPSEAVEYELPPPFGMRREAMSILKERGIDYLLVKDDDIAAEDLRRKPDLWGVALVAETHGVRLYKIE